MVNKFLCFTWRKTLSKRIWVGTVRLPNSSNDMTVHVYGEDFLGQLRECADQLSQIVGRVVQVSLEDENPKIVSDYIL